MENLTWSYCVGEKAKEGKRKFNGSHIIKEKGFMDSYCFLLFVAAFISYTTGILVTM